MIITIQSIPQRMDNVAHLQSQLDNNAIVYTDEKRVGPYGSFVEMLKIPVENYRLHLQDDVILCGNFKEYLREVESLMDYLNLHVLSLFAPNRKGLVKNYNEGKKIVRFDNYLWLQATVFSKEFIECLKENVALSTQQKHDDTFVAETLKKHKLNAYVHLPSLVQHDIKIPSSMKHANNERRASPIYDGEFVNRFLADSHD